MEGTHSDKKEGEAGTVTASKVVYTAIFGDRDLLRDPDPPNDGVDYVCFTDNPDRLQVRAWKLVPVIRRRADPVREARWFKTQPHVLFPGHEISLWVDANFAISGDVASLMERELAGHALAAFRHPDRICLYREAELCALFRLDDPELIRRQTERYRLLGYPENNGLIMASILLRRHNDPFVASCMNQWWAEIDRFSRRDQLSFNYVAWRNGLSYRLFDESILAHPNFHFRGHGEP